MLGLCYTVLTYCLLLCAGSPKKGIKIESFEAMDKRTAREKALEDDHQMAVDLQKSELAASGGGSGRGLSSVALAMQEAESSSSSLYRDTSVSAAKAKSSTSSGGAGIYGSSSYGRSSAATKNTTSLAPSSEAQSRYSSAKSISSDQFFGRDDDHADQMRCEWTPNAV